MPDSEQIDESALRANDHLPFDMLFGVFTLVAERTEIICNILPEARMSMDAAFALGGDPFRQALKLSHVCRTWRSAAFAVPKLWAPIFIGPELLWMWPRDPTGTAECLFQWVQRGADWPRTVLLDLRFDLPPGVYNLDVVIPRMCEFIEMTLVLHVAAEHHEFAQVALNALRRMEAAPNLENLGFTITASMPNSIRPNGWRFFRGNTPKLASLHIENVRLDWRSNYHSAFAKLEFMSLTYDKDLEDASNSVTMPTYMQLFNALTDSPNLYDLHLHGFVPRMARALPPSAETILQLPYLRSLALKSIDPQDMADLVPYLPLQALTHLNLDLWQEHQPRLLVDPNFSNNTDFMQVLFPDDDTITPYPWHDLSSLTHLKISTLKCDEDDYFIMFDAIPQLTHLEMSLTKVFRIIFLPMPPVGEGEESMTFPAPKLQYLRAFAGKSLIQDDQDFPDLFVEIMVKRIENGCQKLRQLIVPQALEEQLRARGDFKEYTEY
ncbi:hypothetical protein BKA62DRAFT_682832 [Auriculariales sp. MPI-PUGE-AT-0066]|nr:hypothetical protein BKA62DRAFT_682832 [Auriculariales sp. MPI-PUGE-AT-0066]